MYVKRVMHLKTGKTITYSIYIALFVVLCTIPPSGAYNIITVEYLYGEMLEKTVIKRIRIGKVSSTR